MSDAIAAPETCSCGRPMIVLPRVKTALGLYAGCTHCDNVCRTGLLGGYCPLCVLGNIERRPT